MCLVLGARRVVMINRVKRTERLSSHSRQAARRSTSALSAPPACHAKSLRAVGAPPACTSARRNDRPNSVATPHSCRTACQRRQPDGDQISIRASSGRRALTACAAAELMRAAVGVNAVDMRGFAGVNACARYSPSNRQTKRLSPSDRGRRCFGRHGCISCSVKLRRVVLPPLCREEAPPRAVPPLSPPFWVMRAVSSRLGGVNLRHIAVLWTYST